MHKARRGALPLLAFALAAPAQAASTPNACRYSYDGLFRDMPVTLTAAATPVAGVVPGDTVRTAPGEAAVELPFYLAPFGYAVGLLHAGRNDIPVKVWVAIRATNTKERVQVVAIDVTASTTITVDPADDDRFLTATPWQYSTPVIPELTWTAVGGDVVFAQDAGGNLPQLPVGTDGALRTVTGSAVIRAGFAGGASIYMDCRPGHTTGIDYDYAGPTYDPAPATPFATVAGPQEPHVPALGGARVRAGAGGAEHHRRSRAVHGRHAVRAARGVGHGHAAGRSRRGGPAHHNGDDRGREHDRRHADRHGDRGL